LSKEGKKKWLYKVVVDGPLGFVNGIALYVIMHSKIG
jgi:hypothetical protein